MKDINNVTNTPADLTALGQFGLAMVTLVASSQKLGITSGLSFSLPWAIFFGGFAQLAACISDYKRNNFFGATVFGAFAIFWFAIATNWLIKLGFWGAVLKSDIDIRQVGFAYAGFLIFVLVMTFIASTIDKVNFIIFILVDFLLLGLSLSSFGVMQGFSSSLAAVAELLVSLAGFYAFSSTTINKYFNRIILPIGKPIFKINI